MFKLNKINLLFYLLVIQIISFSSLLAEEECPELKKIVLYDNEKNLVDHYHYGINIADVKVPGAFLLFQDFKIVFLLIRFFYC